MIRPEYPDADELDTLADELAACDDVVEVAHNTQPWGSSDRFIDVRLAEYARLATRGRTNALLKHGFVAGGMLLNPQVAKVSDGGASETVVRIWPYKLYADLPDVRVTATIDTEDT